ncbi:enoyl-CoA hydratase [Streptomyces boluensis]|uniref:Enoyl-CoA hydratase n=1 Tax=Streptomyces boluensis TaxID=1775135 RepID=A0A964XMX5_9ACTN|nr:enoyl-CoA hydratase [Streptomyces boluensis]NBE53631.1 enoyl-CoA hydratase [Streptomyces boluensis]
MVLTGADPAFCAGLDLRALSAAPGDLSDGTVDRSVSRPPWGEPLRTPLIGAVNGAAVTGGLELALNCDLLIASERARFADTHARVGILPGWRLSVLLPLFVGSGLARRMSLTGDFLPATEALRAGLVTEVVPHEQLLPAARSLAATIAANDPAAVRALLGSYRRIEAQLVGDGDRVEAASARDWRASATAPADVAGRRAAIIARGRDQNRA